MQIINCEVENLEECAKLLVQVYAEPQYKEDWNEFDAHKYLKRFFDIEPNRCFIATENDIIVGGIFFSLVGRTTPSHGTVSSPDIVRQQRKYLVINRLLITLVWRFAVARCQVRTPCHGTGWYYRPRKNSFLKIDET